MKRKKHKRVSFAARITWIFTLLMLLLIILNSFIIYRYVKEKTIDSVKESLQLAIKGNVRNVASAFERIETTVNLIRSDQSGIGSLLNNFDGDMVEGVKNYNKVSSQLQSYLEIAMNQVTGEYSAYLFVDSSMKLSKILSTAYVNGICSDWYSGTFFLHSIKGVTDKPWYLLAKENPGTGTWFKNSSEDDVIYYVRNIKQIVLSNTGFYQRELGVLLIKMNATWLSEYIDMSKLTLGTQIYLLDEHENIIYSNGQGKKFLFSEIRQLEKASEEKNLQIATYKGSSCYLQSETLKNGLKMITVIPEFDISAMAGNVARITLWISGIILIIGCIMVAILSQRIVCPIKILSSHMEESNKLRTILADKVHSDEVGILYTNYNALVERQKQLSKEKLEAVKRKEEAELKTLQAQINPHFLYNTLDSVCCLALIHQEENIADALSSLASILRYNIKNPDACVPLSQEVKIIRNYIDIQKLRSKERIQVQYDFDLDAEGVMVPKMIIQPLIENSIAYGANVESGIVSIILSCSSNGNSLKITVEDEGTCDVDQINAHLKGDIILNQGNGGFGIRNVNQRIKATFGNEYGLVYEHTETNGTAAIVTIPLLLS